MDYLMQNKTFIAALMGAAGVFVYQVGKLLVGLYMDRAKLRAMTYQQLIEASIWEHAEGRSAKKYVDEMERRNPEATKVKS